MEIISEKVESGVVRRRFDLTVDGQTVPGLHWRPEDVAAPPATILFGHGGFQSKEAPNIVAMAESLARSHGYASVALDAPGHGDRRSEDEKRQQDETLRNLRERGVTRLPRREPPPTDPGAGAGGGADGPHRPPRMAREWTALLDALEEEAAGASPGRYGYWGVSMGCRYGIPLLAAEPRISCAVLGLFGLLPDPAFKASVQAIRVPLLFLFQYHDELMTPEAGLRLWEAFGSEEKTMHVNPGPHVGIPVFERDASAAFFVRHLG